MEVLPCPLGDIRELIETHHYSGSVNGVKVSNCFTVVSDGVVIGGILFGMLSTTAWKKYGESERDVVELRRFVLVPGCPRNTASQAMSLALKWMRAHTDFKVCVSYADPYHGHAGYIYQATNWSYLGQTSPDTLLQTPEGKLYHSRAMRTKYKGKLKPFAQRLQDMYNEGVLEFVDTPGKHIYTYQLKGKHTPTGISEYPKLSQKISQSLTTSELL